MRSTLNKQNEIGILFGQVQYILRNIYSCLCLQVYLYDSFHRRFEMAFAMATRAQCTV